MVGDFALSIWFVLPLIFFTKFIKMFALTDSVVKDNEESDGDESEISDTEDEDTEEILFPVEEDEEEIVIDDEGIDDIESIDLEEMSMVIQKDQGIKSASLFVAIFILFFTTTILLFQTSHAAEMKMVNLPNFDCGTICKFNLQQLCIPNDYPTPNCCTCSGITEKQNGGDEASPMSQEDIAKHSLGVFYSKLMTFYFANLPLFLKHTENYQVATEGNENLAEILEGLDENFQMEMKENAAAYLEDFAGNDYEAAEDGEKPAVNLEEATTTGNQDMLKIKLEILRENEEGTDSEDIDADDTSSLLTIQIQVLTADQANITAVLDSLDDSESNFGILFHGFKWPVEMQNFVLYMSFFPILFSFLITFVIFVRGYFM